MKCKISFAATLSVFAHNVYAFSNSSSGNVALYWGQGTGEKSLKSYCDSKSVDIVLLSFLASFPEWELNLDGGCTVTAGQTCNDIGSDIKYCQQKGKMVMLSLGGESGDYGFSSDSQAETFASTLWETFGGGSNSSLVRPLGDAILDGFDLDIENRNTTGYSALVDTLRDKFASDLSRKYYISAAPQCVYPDASLGPVMNNTQLDFAFIQFYNNDCNLNEKLFNWDKWEDYAKNVSPNKNIKLYLGLPASSSSAETGYLDANGVKSRLPQKILKSKYFGGISLWDMSAAFTNVEKGKKFVDLMKSLVKTSSVALGFNPKLAAWHAWASNALVLFVFLIN